MGTDQTHAASPTRALLVTVTSLAGALLMTATAARAAEPAPARTTTEGFSTSSEGLPDAVRDAWLATVLVDTHNGATRPGTNRAGRRTSWGSGVILELAADGRTATVVTNAHVVDCDAMSCRPRVGFARPNSDKIRWATHVGLIATSPDKDLAFLEVAVPDGVAVRAARLGRTPERADLSELVSVGWPDLLLRSTWTVDRPSNHRAKAKRFSQGRLLNIPSHFRFSGSQTGAPTELRVLLHSADTLPGSSGGPLVDRNGLVVGLNTKILRTSASAADRWAHCAEADGTSSGSGCVYLAVAAEEIAAEMTRALGRSPRQPEVLLAANAGPPPER